MLKQLGTKEGYIRFLLDILLVVLLAAILSIRYLIEPIFREELVSPMAIFISVSYPVTDLALLFGVLFLFGKASLKGGSRYVFLLSRPVSKQLLDIVREQVLLISCFAADSPLKYQ
jgi:hypothetical protein